MKPPLTQRWLAQVLLLLVLVLPSLGLSPLLADDIGFPVIAASVMVRDLALLGLVAYFVWSEGEGAQAIGWRPAGFDREAALGALLFLPVLTGLALLQWLLGALGSPPPVPPPAAMIPEGAGQWVLAAFLLVIVAVTEETLFRGFLITRLRALSGSTAFALVLSTLVFAVGHGYQGRTGVVAVAALGLCYGAIFLWRGSLVAPATLHLLQNATGMFILGGG
ncbi:MAG: lysostaphin resistance A-like protein [Thiohalomonadaceae bacterium]